MHPESAQAPANAACLQLSRIHPNLTQWNSSTHLLSCAQHVQQPASSNRVLYVHDRGQLAGAEAAVQKCKCRPSSEL
jgi:hypothetical protein